ncbi:hypothetical protein BGZ82_010035 [Podila clonocystis]|nr:hypothetical protein BGZ82_010035 [Podila clonocystis]
MYHNKQEWDNSPGGGAGARSPFDDAHQEPRQDSYSSASHSNYQQSPHQQHLNQQQQRQHSSFSHQDADDEVYSVVGRPLSYFPTHHQPLSQQEYDDEAQRSSQYHQMSPLEHAQSPLSSRSAEWSGGGYSGYQNPDIPMVGIEIISSNLDARNRAQFSDTRTAENMAEEQQRSNSFSTGAGVGNSQDHQDAYKPYDNKHEPEQQPYQYQQPPPQPQQQQPVVDENGEPIPKALLDPKVQKQLNKRKVFKPWFIWLVSAIQIAILIFEFVRGYQRTNQIIQTNPFNPMIGPGTGMRTGADLERDMGWWRIGIIYMTSGILGFVFGGNFAQLLSPSMGASGSIFGLIGCLVLDLIQNWKLVFRPCWELTKLSLMILVSFAFGLLPFLDNFAHIGGFIGGILTGLIFMPVVYFSKRDKYIKLGLRIIAMPLIVMVLVLGITNFYKGNNTCTWCKYLSCLPINGWCDAFDQSKPPTS